MTGWVIRADAVVMGAGTAGANAAFQLADRGLAVVLVERREMAEGGARWHNGVLDWQFERAGLEPPAGAERVADRGTMHMLGPDGLDGPSGAGGRTGVTVSPSPVVTADMILLGDRLRGLAAERGVRFLERASHMTVEQRAGRITALEVRAADATAVTGTSPELVRDRPVARRSGPSSAGAGERVRLEAPLFVDASGRRGILRRESAVLRPWCPAVRGDELCSATDMVLRVDDPDGAKKYLERFGANPGETISIVGLSGGFSTRGVTVSNDLDEVHVLVGCLANGRYGTGPRMLDELRADEPWIGAPVSGGSGVIPLRRPYARFTAPGLALVGDAACQVFPAHGSGIGMGLIAGRMLADAVSGATDPGGEQVLWDYQAAFQRELGGPLAAFDAFRRMSTALGGEGVRIMVAAGLMSEPMARTGLNQTWELPPNADVPAMAARLARHPHLAARMLPMLARGRLAATMGARYPAAVDEAALTRWDHRVERLLGRLPS